LVRGGRGTAGQPKGGAGPVAAGASFSIPITTVSMLGNFDAVQFPNQRGNPIAAELVVDSGNSNMIIPNG
jgi:hypothetical protein